MNGWKLARLEWARLLSNRKLIISVVAVLLVPLLYSYLYLWAFWDPYERLDQLPVAFVNQDAGTVTDGKSVNLGEELADKLKEDPELAFHFTDESEALAGMEDGRYYMMIQIPTDFSKQAASVSDASPARSKILYVPNESLNMLSAQIGERAMETLRNELQRKMTETYADTLFEKIAETGNGLGEAADGASQLKDGLVTAEDGAAQLQSGTADLSSGAVKLSDGAAQLKTGTGQLVSGLQQSRSGSEQLHAGLTTLQEKGNLLQNSTAQLSGGIQKASGAVASLAPKLSETGAGLHQVTGLSSAAAATWQALLEKNPELLGQPEAKALAQQLGAVNASLPKLDGAVTTLSGHLNTLNGSMGQLAAGSGKLSEGVTAYVGGVSQSQAGAAKLATAQGQLLDGAARIDAGATAVHNGLNTLVGGTTRLADGTAKLSDGVVKLRDGSQELAQKLGDGAEEVQANLVATDAKADMIADPVDLETSKLHPVPNYGTGFSPYFISLALFVGALLLFIILDVHQVAALPKRGTAWLFGKFSLYGLFGILQALVVAFSLQVGLGLTVENVPGFYLMCILTSLTFVALIQGLISLLGEPGRFLAIVILMLQLTSSAGTFPLELSPTFFQVLNPYLPMTYTVAGLKAVISNGDAALITTNVSWLLLFLIGTLAVTSLFTWRRHPGTQAEAAVTA
ncbi:YhgE/Pip domain-containing protein [Tumebacillus sp. DT12]|uniref:YhgE/Pip domain-containing protein n=1 Tax=Tumebacillus lacus TaxID=2995335 RepID=A0ABT3X163_9BACL|nr:YhgE/Pip domain-containing protein [Tumebacillus lacus]MCX7570629.1 YhgE/Pip domain-containing protein [Tumebacillus lacus]